MNRELFLKKVFIRAIKDPVFREELKKNPKKIIEEELQESLPKELNVKIIEELSNEWVIALPKSIPKTEIPDEELRKIAGGATGMPPVSLFSCNALCPHKKN